MSERERDERAIEIGQRIVQARRETGGMTQRELAELLHVSERSMQAYESGEVTPYRHLRELERILGKPMAWFLYGDEALRSSQTTCDDVLAALDELRRDFQSLVERLS